MQDLTLTGSAKLLPVKVESLDRVASFREKNLGVQPFNQFPVYNGRPCDRREIRFFDSMRPLNSMYLSKQVTLVHVIDFFSQNCLPGVIILHFGVMVTANMPKEQQVLNITMVAMVMRLDKK